ncbi:MAG: phenylalanine--tRNA ligase subunit alpha [Candidatus Aenigmarchaeota archaeon]|nr:phenylalanine--tRNA ligase subunit alpha [Candidatus Aenigmarchaeota archaeon]
MNRGTGDKRSGPMYRLTEEGKRYLENGLPEERLMAMLKVGKSLPLAEAKVENLGIALQWAKKKGWVGVEGGKIMATGAVTHSAERAALENTAAGKPLAADQIRLLLERNLITERKERGETRPAGDIKTVTPELLKTGQWKNANFAPYNVELVGEKAYPGKPHIIEYYKGRVREIFVELGFREESGPLVESGFWNFDALFQPQDHPARDMADTFYMEKPATAKLPDKKIVSGVKGAHENGAGTGSRGWRYAWNEAIARQAVLRTHTTAVSARCLARIKPPAKAFSIGTVFRNEAITYKSLPQFTQIEGIVADESVTFRNLLGYLKEFYLRMGFEKVRFRPAYFPYTEMSVEPEVYFAEKGAWLELGGSGIFRPEVTKPLGIEVPVLAWGLGLERLVMLLAGLNDIRNFYYRNDLKMLREMKLWR